MRILFFTITMLVCSAVTLSQPTIISNVRTAAHIPLAKIKLSIVSPADYLPLPDDAGFFLRGSKPENGDEQIKASKFFIDFASIKASLLSSGAAHIDIRINNYDGIIIRAKQTIEGHVFTSLTLGFGNSFYSYVIVGLLPNENASVEAKLRASIQSAYVDTFGYSGPTLKANILAQRFKKAENSLVTRTTSKFKIDITGTGFKIAEIISDDRIIYSLDGSYPPVGTDKSQLDAQHNFATVSEGSFETYCEQILNMNSDFNSVSNIRKNPIEINGIKGIEITADARSMTASTFIKVYQAILFGTNEVYAITGIAFLQSLQMIEDFKKVTRTFTTIP